MEGTAHDNPRMLTRIAAFVTWAAVAASLVFWALRLTTQPAAAPAHATAVSTASAFQGDLSRVLGADAPGPAAATPALPQADARFKLIGVVAPRLPEANAEGLALIATDGKAPKAYRVGAPVDGELVLLSVRARGASLGPRGQPAQFDLELPALPPPASGTRPPGVGLPPRGAGPQVAPLPMVPPAVAPAPAPQAGADADADDEPQPMPRAPASPARPPT